MAFVAEDGTGLADANSLCSVEFADAYFADRGIAAWTGSTTVKQQALVRATDYIVTRFDGRFRQDPFSDEQALPFPWEDSETGEAAPVPAKVGKANAEYALRALTATLAPDPVTHESGQRVTEFSEKVGPLNESTKFQEGGAVSTFRPYPAADALLREYVRSTNVVIRG